MVFNQMKTLELTLPTPELNLACDQILLDLVEAGFPHEVLRFWETPRPFVVLGLSNRAQAEVNLAAAKRLKIPVLRRISGGGAVLQGPGCLNFSLILKIPDSGALTTIGGTNRFVLNRNRQALEPLLGQPIRIQGDTDLTLGTMKFSGNAQRRKRRALLFHGTFLIQADVKLMKQLLPLPAKQPSYRNKRSHAAFLAPLPLTAQTIKAALRSVWDAKGKLTALPQSQIRETAKSRYASSNWNLKR